MDTKRMGAQDAKERIWTRDFIILTCVNFFSSLLFYLMNVIITGYVMESYAAPYATAALAVTLYVIGSLVARLILGPKIDVWGVKIAIIVGYGFNFAVSLAYFLPLSLEVLYVVRFLHGMTFSLQSGATIVGAALLLPASRKAEGIGYFSMALALGTAIGPYVAQLLTGSAGGYATLFVFLSAMSLLAFLLTFLVRVPKARQAHPGDAGEGEGPANLAPAQKPAAKSGLASGLGKMISFVVVPLASVMFLIYFCYGGLLSFVLTYGEENGISHEAGIFFLVFAVFLLFGRICSGRRVDKHGENSVLYATIILAAVAYVVLVFPPSGILLLISAALLGVGQGSTQSVVQALAVTLVPEGEMGKASSTVLIALDLGSGLGPVLWGLVLQAANFQLMYLAMAVVCVCALVLYHFAHGRSHSRR